MFISVFKDFLNGGVYSFVIKEG